MQVVFQVFPLHHTPSLENLQKSWVRKLFGLQPLGENIKSPKPPSKSLCAGEISEYFGLKIAFYFAWLGHYTTALSIPAIVGGAFWVGVAILFKGILHQKNFYRLNLIFWIVMGCGIARFGRKGLKTTET